MSEFNLHELIFSHRIVIFEKSFSCVTFAKILLTKMMSHKNNPSDCISDENLQLQSCWITTRNVCQMAPVSFMVNLDIVIQCCFYWSDIRNEFNLSNDLWPGMSKIMIINHQISFSWGMIFKISRYRTKSMQLL